MTVENADYTYLAQRFAEENDIEVEGPNFGKHAGAQYEVCREEYWEFKQAFERRNYDKIKEEIADVLVTMFLMARILDIDIDEAYQRKMEYNLGKTGVRDENGKIVDDAGEDKPDFAAMTDGFKP